MDHFKQIERMVSIPILCVNKTSSWTQCHISDANGNSNAHVNIDASVNEPSQYDIKYEISTTMVTTSI